MTETDDDREEQRAASLPDFLQDPLGMLRRRWLWMLGVLVLGLVGTLAWVVTLQPIYLATATVLVRSQQIPETFVRPTVEEDPLRRIDEMVGQVLTQDRLAGLVDKHGLYPQLQDSLPLSEVIAIARSSIEIAPAAGYSQTSRGESARLFTVSFAYREPVAAATVANEIAGLLPSESVRSRTRQARLTTEFLQRELDRAAQELREQSAKITEFKEQYRGELPGELPSNLSRLERLQAQRQSLSLQIAESANRVATLAAQGGTAAAGSDPASRLEELRGRLSIALATQTERHPDVTALRGEIAALEAELARRPAASSEAPTTASALAAAEQVTLRELRSQLAATEGELAGLDVRVARTPARQEELGALEEKESVLRETYLEFLRKVQEAELAQNLEATQSGERVSVLNWATPPTRPEHEPWKYLLAGLLASFGAALAVGVLLEIFDPFLLSTEQMETAGELPVLGSVPRIV